MSYADTLNSFRDLEEDWDSYGASRIDPQVIEGTACFLNAILTGAASIVPTRSGGVQVEVHRDGWDVEVEFDPFTDDDDAAGGVYLMHRSDSSGLPKRGEKRDR